MNCRKCWRKIYHLISNLFPFPFSLPFPSALWVRTEEGENRREGGQDRGGKRGRGRRGGEQGGK